MSMSGPVFRPPEGTSCSPWRRSPAIGLAVSMVPTSASTASPALVTSRLDIVWQSGQALSSRTSRPYCALRGRNRVTINYSGKEATWTRRLTPPWQVAHLPSSSRADPARCSPRQEGCNQHSPSSGSEASNYGAAWNKLVTYNGKLYGLVQGANKNTIWYNPAEFALAVSRRHPPLAAAANRRGHAEEAG